LFFPLFDLFLFAGDKCAPEVFSSSLLFAFSSISSCLSSLSFCLKAARGFIIISFYFCAGVKSLDPFFLTRLPSFLPSLPSRLLSFLERQEEEEEEEDSLSGCCYYYYYYYYYNYYYIK